MGFIYLWLENLGNLLIFKVLLGVATIVKVLEPREILSYTILAGLGFLTFVINKALDK